MKKANLLIGIVLFSISGCFPVLAQSGKVERKRNLFGTYKYRQGGQQFSEKTFLQKMPVNSDAYRLMRNARRNKVVGSILGGVGGALAGSQLSLKSNGDLYSREMLFTGIGLFAVGLHFGGRYVAQSGLATDLYNQPVTKSSFKMKPEFEIGLAGPGIGFQMKF